MRDETTLMARLASAGLAVHDLREVLTRHKTKVWKTRSVAGLHGIVFHHAAGDGSFQSVARYHVGPNHISTDGLPSISYTMGIDTDGSVCLFNDLNQRTYSHGSKAHPGDENSEFLGILVRGNLWSPGNPEGHDPTPAQMESVKRVTAFFMKDPDWLIPAWDVYGHYHFGKRLCPGAAVESYIEYVRSTATAPRIPVWYRNTTKNRQEALRRLGLYKGNIDGIWGRKSDAALRTFESLNGLNINGIWDGLDEVAIAKALLG